MHVCAECGERYPDRGFCPRDGTALADNATDPLLGEAVGSYRVARLLGAGGMGRVYKGVHPTIGSRVAIKVLSADCVRDPQLVARFFDEARAVNLIHHESIVNVLDLARLPDGRPFIVMEYLDGAPLSAVIADRGPLPLGGLARAAGGRVARAAGELLDALAAAHDKGIIHRDLKPDNVFIAPSGRAKVLDFGIAKLIPELGGHSDPTRTGSLLGTPHYMSPEQTLARRVDARSDLYSVGVILFEGATGQKPFAAESLFDLLRQHVEVAPPPPRSLRPDLPPAYEAVILRALGKAPGDRFPDARAMASALADASRALPEAAWASIAPRASAGGAIAIGPPTPQRTPSERVPFAATVPSGATTERTDPTRKSRGPLLAALTAAAAIAGTLGYLAARNDKVTGVSETSVNPVTDVSETSVNPPVTDVSETPVNPMTDVSETQVNPPVTDVSETPVEPVTDVSETLTDVSETPVNADLPARMRRAGSRAAKRPAVSGRPDAGSPAVVAVPPDPPPATGFDATRVDVTAMYPRALRLARKQFPDAVFVRLDADGVGADGIADLTMKSGSSVLFRFISPSQHQKNLELGPDRDPQFPCLYYVSIDADGVHPYTLKDWKCDDYVPIGKPACSVARVWKKAVAAGADPRRRASVGIWASPEGVGRWSFDIDGGYSSWIADDC